jgi:hypothetical protein
MKYLSVLLVNMYTYSCGSFRMLFYVVLYNCQIIRCIYAITMGCGLC